MRSTTLLALTAAITIPAIASAQAPRADRFHQVAPQNVQMVSRNIVTAKPVGTSVGSTASPWYEQGPLQTSSTPPAEVQRTMFYASEVQSSPSDANAADYAPSLAPSTQAPPTYLPPKVVAPAPSTNWSAATPSTTTYAAPAPTTTSVSPAVCYSSPNPIPTVAPATYAAPAPTTIVTQSPIITGPTVVSPPPVRFNTTYRPILPVAGIPADFSVGQGIYGQPRVYVDNQPVRNFFRYILP
ncbi:hypothetical protein LOC68_20225 [Blastopirellula sp. JC732]|uniref:Uncharacterized protein n=1 Tax=Blastopirellula sediminis TaxID=2894196 RepID=A0A9X1MQ60_9BACT|nr:hypothetical protein [Blastopirellula sediminis]MCC9605972.1 hypothetical protein [Blastopirellula sediminis]MCC9630729.1 hypothetical protein [Blastopirellula sediminis]